MYTVHFTPCTVQQCYAVHLTPFTVHQCHTLHFTPCTVQCTPAYTSATQCTVHQYYCGDLLLKFSCPNLCMALGLCLETIFLPKVWKYLANKRPLHQSLTNERLSCQWLPLGCERALGMAPNVGLPIHQNSPIPKE